MVPGPQPSLISPLAAAGAALARQAAAAATVTQLILRIGLPLLLTSPIKTVERSTPYGMRTSLTRSARVRSATYGGTWSSAAEASGASTIHHSVWPPSAQEPNVVWWRSGLS